jgi:hypothetical protein
LSDYDLVGSVSRATGLFALNQIDHFDLLYLPPPEISRVPGPAAVLAAEIYCRKRGAMLILDPPDQWKNPRDAVKGVRDAGYANSDVISYFHVFMIATMMDLHRPLWAVPLQDFYANSIGHVVLGRISTNAVFR